MKIKISIVFPVYNEVNSLQKVIKEWSNKLAKVDKLNFEFVIVEDGSTDGTKELIQKLEMKYPINNQSQKKRRGYTKAVVDGIYASRGKYILCTDSDDQIRVENLIKNLNNLPQKKIFVIGCRSPRNDPFFRIIYSKLFKIFHDFLFNTKLKDPSCPFVIGNASDFKKLPKNELLFTREAFWWGFVAIARKRKFLFKEIFIKHEKRVAGEAGYSLTDLPFIILRNMIAMIKIKIKYFHNA